MQDSGRQSETQAASGPWVEQAETRIPALTLLAHPDPRRVGERTLLDDLAAGHEARLARNEPAFSQPGERVERPLEDARISRSPIRLSAAAGGGLKLDPARTSTPIEVDGDAIQAAVELNAEAVERGVVLCISRRIVLLLHRIDPLAGSGSPPYGLVGASDAIGRVRSDIRQLAPLQVPVLLRGETGTGKELVARALHREGPRKDGPFVAVNMASIPPSLAAAELFGARKGAYTGSSRDRQGAFRRAHGGTLFLDEIGDTPADIQALLLRALESHEVVSVGADRGIRVDLRLVTATDLDLESAIESGRFRSPLLHRIAGYEIRLPALRERRDDFGRLFFHFLAREAVDLNREADTDRPWPPAEVVARLARRPWAGNVRQLENAVRQLVILGADSATSPARLSAWLESAGVGPRAERPGRDTPADADEPALPARTRPRDLDDQRLLEVLRVCRYRVQDAARQLGISRAAVYKLIDRSPRLRKASDIGRDEIRAAGEQCDGDLDAMVERLEVSAPALRRRMRQLGLG